jgi:hypothetical protein
MWHWELRPPAGGRGIEPVDHPIIRPSINAVAETCDLANGSPEFAPMGASSPSHLGSAAVVASYADREAEERIGARARSAWVDASTLCGRVVADNRK